MSTIAVNAITDANGGSTTSINGTTPNAYNTVGKNLIINGAMQIAQRGTSSTSTGYGTVDRWQIFRSASVGSHAFTASQETDAPDGFSNSFKITTTTAAGTVGTNDYFNVGQEIEAQTLQQLAYGTTSAKKVTLSFWVKSSQTGTYSIGVYATDGNRVIGSTYAINTANTWEKKSVTIDGDTAGTINNDNGAGLRFYFNLAAGSTYNSTDNTSWATYSNGNFAYGGNDNVVNNLNATWQITGVQLEVGESATEFEHRSYGIELGLCERYYQLWSSGWAGVSGGANYNQSCYSAFRQTMRATPTMTRLSGTDSARFPASSWYAIYTYTEGSAFRMQAATAGGNDAWYAKGSADAEL